MASRGQLKSRFSWGTNEIQLSALNHQGIIVGSDSITVESNVPNPVSDSLRITEINFHPHNPTALELALDPALDDNDFEFIEFQNVGTETIDLSAVQFTEGVEFTFPHHELASGDYAIIVRDANAFSIRYPNVAILGEFNGGLSNGGERIEVATAAGEVFSEIDFGDRDPWFERADGVGATLELMDPMSVSSFESGQFYRWRASSELGGSPGTVGGGSSGIVINEVLSNTDAAGAFDSIELWNASDIAVDMSNWFLSDSSNDLFKFEIPGGTILSAGEFIVFDERDFNAAAQGDKRFLLNGSDGDDVWLVATDGSGRIVEFVDDVHFGAAAPNESFGRVIDSSRLAPMTETTIGTVNSRERVGPVVITEVHYNPGAPSDASLNIDPDLNSDDLEFIEITNMGNAQVSLIEWSLSKGVAFDFPSTDLAPEASLIIVSFQVNDGQNATRLRAFRAHYGIEETVPIVGGYSGMLGNDFDQIRLQRPGETPDGAANVPRLYEDEITYTDRGRWPTSADGSGDSLQRSNSLGWGNKSRHWIGSSPNPGVFEAVDADFNDDGLVDEHDIDLIASAINGADLQFDLTRDGVVDVADIEFVVENVLGTVIGDSNLDGTFNSRDLVLIFQIGEYDDEVSMNSGWRDGDWNGDQEFDSRDLVFAFQKGSFSAASIAKYGAVGFLPELNWTAPGFPDE